MIAVRNETWNEKVKGVHLKKVNSYESKKG